MAEFIKWNEANNDELRDHHATGKTAAEIGALMGFTRSVVEHRRRNLGLKSPMAPQWTEEKKALLKELYPSDLYIKEIIARLGTTYQAVDRQARRLGLKRPSFTVPRRRAAQSGTWTPERDEMLRSGRLAGKTYSELKVSIGVTRNAIIGRARRIGIASIHVAPTAEQKQARIDAKVQRIRLKLRQNLVNHNFQLPQPKPFKHRCVDVAPKNLSFENMRFGHLCAYPTHEADAPPSYCGHDVGLKKNGKPSSYCQGHHQVAHA